MNPRQGELRSKIRELVGDVQSIGTLRRQAADLGTQFGDYGVVMAIDKASDGEWMPLAVRYKYAHFFTHWAILATTRLADHSRQSTSIPALVNRLRSLRQEGEMRRDRWIERIVGITQWRKAQEAEKQESIERLIAKCGGPIWVQCGPGEKAARLSEIWNNLTGHERERDGPNDEMDDWILDSAVQPLESPEVQVLRTWRDKNLAHQDMSQTQVGSAGYDVYPMRPLVRAYWVVMKAAHRALLLAEGTGLHGLYPIPGSSVTLELSGGKVDVRQTEIIDERLLVHSTKWDCLLKQAEQRWYRELKALRQRTDQ